MKPGAAGYDHSSTKPRAAGCDHDSVGGYPREVNHISKKVCNLVEATSLPVYEAYSGKGAISLRMSCRRLGNFMQ